MKIPHFISSLTALLFLAAALPAADLNGTVRSTDGTTAAVVLSSDLVPAVGDKVDIFVKLPGFDDDVSVATAKVTAVSTDSVQVKVETITGTLTTDCLVRIHAANPVKRGVPGAAVPMPAATPATPVVTPLSKPLTPTPPLWPEPTGELPETLLIHVNAQLVGMNQHPPEPAAVPHQVVSTQPRTQWTAADHFSEGWTLHIAGDYKGAVAAYTEAIKLDPAHSNALYGRARAALVVKEYDTVIADTTRVLELPGALSDTYTLRGSGYAGKGEMQKAVDDFEQAVLLSPSDALAWNNRGDVRFRLNDLKGALEDTLYASRVDRQHALPLYNLGFIYEALGQKAEAAAAWKKALTRDPAYAAALQPRIQALSGVTSP